MLSASHINNIRISITHGYLSDRTYFKKTIGDIFPGDTTIIGFTNTATGVTHIINTRVGWVACNSIGTTSAEGANVTPLNTFVKGSIKRRLRCWFRLGFCFLCADLRSYYDASSQQEIVHFVHRERLSFLYPIYSKLVKETMIIMPEVLSRF